MANVNLPNQRVLCIGPQTPHCYANYRFSSSQKPKLSNKEFDSGSSNTLEGGLCPPSTDSLGGVGKSATTSELRLRSMDNGFGPPKLLKIVGAGRRNSQLRTVDNLAFDENREGEELTEI
jgi:hypothetical protein